MAAMVTFQSYSHKVQFSILTPALYKGILKDPDNTKSFKALVMSVKLVILNKYQVWEVLKFYNYRFCA